ncbi:hypothetical protein FQR65_LT17802 [Abscondita terminalis]|nr:hypothetical protein FQR65_LT17802 [Abscondita terminalis]
MDFEDLEDVEEIELIEFGLPRQVYVRSNYFDSLDDYSFRRRFRLSRQCTVQLLALIQHELEFPINTNQHRLHRQQLRDASDPLTIPENTFRGIYRVSRQLAHELMNTLYPFLPDGERNFIPCQLKVLAALHFYAQGSYQKAVGQDYSLGLSQSSVSRCIKDVNTALENLYHLIKFPTTEEECQIESKSRNLFITRLS